MSQDEAARRDRTIITEPENGTAGLAVSYKRDVRPHETKIIVEQLWPPTGGREGRAEPVYVGGASEAMQLISALADYAQEDVKNDQ